MLHILHGADLHLDAPFTGLSAEQARQRRAELRELPRRLAELARARGADLVLLSGDLFDGSDPYAETAQALDIPQGTVVTRQRRALALLKLELSDTEEV